MRPPNIKTVKIGNQTFDLGRVYSNPFHNAFLPTNESPKLMDILFETGKFDNIDHDKITEYYRTQLKKEKVLKKVKKKDFEFILTDRNKSDDDFYGAVTSFHIPSGLYAGDLDIAKWSGISDTELEGAVQVHPTYRRQKVATEMYNLAERYFKKKFKPASPQSKDATNFWKNRKNI